jgi:hypothetical protein
VPFSYSLIDPIKTSLEAAGFIDLQFIVITIQKEIADAALSHIITGFVRS